MGLFALIDVLLVALPCCSPVQELDKLYYRRAAQGEKSMPGLTFSDGSGRDGLFLGLGDFLVFSTLSGHVVRVAGWAPTAVVAAGLLAGLAALMLHVALKWPLRALEPAIPLSIVCAAVLLACERLALRPLSEALNVAGLRV